MTKFIYYKSCVVTTMWQIFGSRKWRHDKKSKAIIEELARRQVRIRCWWNFKDAVFHNHRPLHHKLSGVIRRLHRSHPLWTSIDCETTKNFVSTVKKEKSGHFGQFLSARNDISKVRKCPFKKNSLTVEQFESSFLPHMSHNGLFRFKSCYKRNWKPENILILKFLIFISFYWSEASVIVNEWLRTVNYSFDHLYTFIQWQESFSPSFRYYLRTCSTNELTIL